MQQNTLADALIVTAIAAAILGYLYLRYVERRRKLEIIHAERLAAIEKGIPLPEIPADFANTRKPRDPREPLMHGVAWTALGFGFLVALLVIGPLPNGQVIWPLPLPLLFLGVGLMLYYALASERAR